MNIVVLCLFFLQCISSVYTLVTQKKAQDLYNKVGDTMKSHGNNVYKRVSQHTDDTFLKELLSEWNFFSSCLRKLNDILLFLNESYVIKTSTHDDKLPTVYENGVLIFKDEVILNVQQRIQRLMLDIIRNEREKEIVGDRIPLHELTVMMTDIDRENVYKKIFENEFLEQSRIFFNRESQKYSETSTTVFYLTMVKKRLEEEQDRARSCLDKDTLQHIEKVVYDELIEKYKDVVVRKEGSGVEVMLTNQKTDDLRLVYEVLGLVEGALNPTIEMLKKYCIKEAKVIVQDQKKDNNPEELVTEMISLRQSYEDLLLNAFSYISKGTRIRDKNFSKAVKEAFDETVNLNPRFSEYLSLLLDKKLKKGKNQIEDDNSDDFFDKVIMIFRHVQDKDVFERYYKIHLAKRLLSGRSASDDSEKSFLSKLKTSFGIQYTSKLEGMFKDMKISEELHSDWQQYNKSKNIQADFDINVQVLTQVYWPVSKVGDVSIPSQHITNIMNIYQDFYIDKHQGRTITWQYNMGTADLKANGYSKQYEFNVSSYQMAILLLFNQEDTLTLLKLSEQLKIPLQDLKRNLITLCMPAEKGKASSKLIVKKSESEDKKFDENTAFCPNEKFKSQKMKLKILPVVKKEDDDEHKQTKTMIDEERKWVMDSVIVKIMKTRKQLFHRELIMEVTQQLQGRFMPSPDIIKKRIESLIEREYLERDPEDRSLYIYKS